MKSLLFRTIGFLAFMALAISYPRAAEKNEGNSATKTPPAPGAQVQAESLQALKIQIDALKSDYEKRIKDLEAQVQQLQTQMLQAAPEAAEAAAAPPPQAVQAIPGALNPAISAIGNFVARGDSQKVFNDENERIDNKKFVREAEIDMRVPVDPYADAVLIASLESSTPGRFSIDVEEGYVNIKKLPFLASSPLGLKLKVGRFRPAFGKVNILHTHDLPQSFRPLPIQEFLGEEGFNQNGVSGNFFIPTPWDPNSNLDVTLEFLNGGDIAISPEIRSRASYLGHVRWFRNFGDANIFELGLSGYFHPRGNEVASTNFQGLDFLYRWKPLRLGEWKSFLLGGELMFAHRPYPEAAEPPDVARAIAGLQPGHGKPLGYTLFGQWQFDRRKYAGVRWDQTTTMFDPRLKRRSVTPYLSYYFSEFLRFRVNYEHRWSDLFTEDQRNSVFLELNWVFGSHPPEPFWVNK
ncbi:MAG TPA: hypothetical protein VGQ81_14940 [Acidobacteriota bacterium]|jgi:hypothetical protein|nr:hypothetical protein [Acidobacteriota bacterium]